MSEQKMNKEIQFGLSSPWERRSRGEAWKVVIAGSGPGDAELITIKLQKRLKEAEVIITDRLVNPAIIEENAKKDVEVIFTGKQGYHDGSVSQEEINKL